MTCEQCYHSCGYVWQSYKYCKHTELSTNLYFFLSTLDLMKKAERGDGKHDSEVCVVHDKHWNWGQQSPRTGDLHMQSETISLPSWF